MDESEGAFSAILKTSGAIDFKYSGEYRDVSIIIVPLYIWCLVTLSTRFYKASNTRLYKNCNKSSVSFWSSRDVTQQKY